MSSLEETKAFNSSRIPFIVSELIVLIQNSDIWFRSACVLPAIEDSYFSWFARALPSAIVASEASCIESVNWSSKAFNMAVWRVAAIWNEIFCCWA